LISFRSENVVKTKFVVHKRIIFYGLFFWWFRFLIHIKIFMKPTNFLFISMCLNINRVVNRYFGCNPIGKWGWAFGTVVLAKV
ncbi:MAG: hypothetical protein ACPG7E_04485, partial [Marinirhabdus sp.]